MQTPLPRMAAVRQEFERPRVDDPAAETVRQLRGTRLLESVGPGATVAITAGSRGIADLAEILTAVTREIRAHGAKPLVVPAMGSHGGATAEGQRALLEGMGVTEAVLGAPIASSMEVVQIGQTTGGLPVTIDRVAAGSDAVLLVNRIKPHVSFRGRYESGLFKMMAIGLGKQHGAQICHDLGFGRMASNVEAVARVILANAPILGGIAILENAYHETARIEAVAAGAIAAREPELLEEARRLSPTIYLSPIDVLVIDRIGKDISGTGFDTNVVGRYNNPYVSGGPDVTRLVLLDLTDASHGNANGVGMGDFTTERLFRKMSFAQTYPNALTSTVPASVKVPMVLANDRLAIQAAVRTSNVAQKETVRMVRIRDTQSVSTISVSENLLPEVGSHGRMIGIGRAEELAFDPNGDLVKESPWH